MDKKRISFDFDSTLSEDRIQRLAKELSAFYDLWIVSSRVNEDRFGWNKIVFSVADKIGIDHSKIIFTDGADKWKYLKEYNIIMHFDDDEIAIELIDENYPQCIGIITYDTDYLQNNTL